MKKILKWIETYTHTIKFFLGNYIKASALSAFIKCVLNANKTNYTSDYHRQVTLQSLASAFKHIIHVILCREYEAFEVSVI